MEDWCALIKLTCGLNNNIHGKSIVSSCSGLAAAYKLKSHGLKVTVFEADTRAGGKLKSISQDGLLWDEGANTMVSSYLFFGEYAEPSFGSLFYIFIDLVFYGLVIRYVFIQTESGTDVSNLLDNLGLREIQQFVSICHYTCCCAAKFLIHITFNLFALHLGFSLIDFFGIFLVL